MKPAMTPPIALMTNTQPALTSCLWCRVRKGHPHSAACPLGERYAQIQQSGGIGFLDHASADCAALCDRHQRAGQRGKVA